jgi:eukaryotic-like serine/threonine-protein kinase
VLIEALTGRRAFPGDPLSSAQARLERDATIPDGLPPDLARLLAAMTAGDPGVRPDAAAASVALRRALVDAEPLTMPSVIVGPSTMGTPSVLGGLALTAGPAEPVPASRWARLAPTNPRGIPRATGTRGALVIAALAVSAVLAGTVAMAGSGPVVTADSARPAAIVPGGATVGAPDPHALTLAPAPAAPSSSQAPEPSDESSPAPETTRAPRTREAAAAPTRKTTHTTRPSSTEPTRSTTPTTDETTPAEDTSSPRPKPPGPVGGLLQGVGGLVGGVLRGGR